ncbi:hypothetical protein EDC04DRAFT_2647697 [Pisolithus marmoratus]|nr:hypothetical protein EDC04DRAFT_2647697 [Pisolithus marmoratus]
MYVTQGSFHVVINMNDVSYSQKAAANEYEPVTQVVSLMEHSEDLDPDEISRCFTGNCSAKTLHLSPKMLCRLPRKGTIIFRTRTYCVDIEELVKEGIPVAARFGEYSQALALGCFRVLRMEAVSPGDYLCIWMDKGERRRRARRRTILTRISTPLPSLVSFPSG